MNLSKVLDTLNKNAIKLEFNINNKGDLPIGSSKFGGEPDVPENFEWFYYTGEDFDGVTKKRPLSFLAQINCKEINMYDEDRLLPIKGILYFFYELSTMKWGFDPEDKGSAKVFYFNGDITELKRKNFPHDLEDEFKLPEVQLGFSKKSSLPCYEEFTLQYDYDNWDHFDQVKENKGHQHEETISKMLGYADLIQGEMLLECELVTNGIYCGNTPEITPEELKKFEGNCNQWQLLFQLDTVTTQNFELMFGDCGRIYYFIKKEDLKKGHFDDCWLVLQCY